MIEADENEIDRWVNAVLPSLVVRYRKAGYLDQVGYTFDQVHELLVEAIAYGREQSQTNPTPAMDLAELRNKSGRSCDNVARIIRLPNSYRHIELGVEVFGADAIKALATLYDCDKSEVESAAAETRRRKASGLYD